MTDTTTTTEPTTTTDTATTATRTLTLPSRVFGAAMASALEVTSTDDRRRILASVHLRTLDDGTLRVEATDSYRLLRLDIFPEAHGLALPMLAEEFPLISTLDKAANKALLALCKVPKNLPTNAPEPTVTLEFRSTVRTLHTGDTMTTPRNLIVTAANGATAVLELVDGEYPNVDGLIPVPAGLSASSAGFNPDYLAGIAKMARAMRLAGVDSDAVVRLVHVQGAHPADEALKPALFAMTVRDFGELTYLLMPVRTS